MTICPWEEDLEALGERFVGIVSVEEKEAEHEVGLLAGEMVGHGAR